MSSPASWTSINTSLKLDTYPGKTIVHVHHHSDLYQGSVHRNGRLFLLHRGYNLCDAGRQTEKSAN